MTEKKRKSAYETLLLARAKDRPKIRDYITFLIEDFLELKGDRLHGDDPSIVGGIGRFHGVPVTVVGHRKGRTTEESVACRFGMTSPEGYRKALRLMEQAEKFHRPILTFIDTPGAYPGVEAEANGQAAAIAASIGAMSRLRTPIISLITGEGSSGGALAIGVADRVLMLEHAVYSVLSPEGFASILWKDSKRVGEACDCMKITAPELAAFGLIDGVIPDAGGMQEIDQLLWKELQPLLTMDTETLVEARYRKYREIDGSGLPLPDSK